jgi:hypothetical protein
MHSVLVGTRAEIFAETGNYRGQIAAATDYGVGDGLRYVWNGTAWVLPSFAQVIGMQATDVSNDADTAEKTLYTCNLPPLGINDGVITQVKWDMTSSANNKTLRMRVAGTQIYSQAFTANESDVRDLFFFNRAATNANISGHANSNVYGGSGADLSTSAVQTNVATALTITGQKANSGEVLTLKHAWTRIFGGTARP